MFQILHAWIISSAQAQTTQQPPPLALPSGSDLDLATGSLGGYISLLINVFLGALGLVFIVILLYNAFKYLTAGSDSNTVQQARDGITNAIIGLLIIGGAWLIAQFVLTVVFNT